MKILIFENESGDGPVAICLIDKELTDQQIKNIVIDNIGDDYVEYTEEEMIENNDGERGEICGSYYFVDYSNLPTASDLLKEIK